MVGRVLAPIVGERLGLFVVVLVSCSLPLIILSSKVLVFGVDVDVDGTCLGFDVDGLFAPLLMKNCLRSFFLSAVQPFSPRLLTTSRSSEIFMLLYSILYYSTYNFL